MKTAKLCDIFAKSASIILFNLISLEQIQMDVDEGYLCGQTAYVLESHRLRISAAIMTEENGQNELEERIIRPHLQVYRIIHSLLNI